jgi:RNA polymerase sigma-70 factor (ECF subfamily)
MAINRHEMERLIPSLRRFARGLTGDAQAADDLVQDALWRALRKERQFRGDNLAAWLFAILANGAKAQARSLRRRPLVGPLIDTADGGSDPASRIGILSALASLEAEHREVLLLTAVEGFTYRETAEIVGVPTGTVMSRIARARDELAQRLEGAPIVPVRRVR